MEKEREREREREREEKIERQRVKWGGRKEVDEERGHRQGLEVVEER